FMMPRAESEACLNAKRKDAVRNDAFVVCAVNEEAARPYRRQSLLRELHPVLIGYECDVNRRTSQPREKIAVGHVRIERLDVCGLAERFLVDEHGLWARRRDLKQRGNVASPRFRTRDVCFPERRSLHRTRQLPQSATTLNPLASRRGLIARDFGRLLGRRKSKG